MIAGLPFPVDAKPVLRFRVDCHPRGKARGSPYRTGEQCPLCRKGTGKIVVPTKTEDVKLEQRIAFHAGEARFRQQVRMLDEPLIVLVVALWPRIKRHAKLAHQGRLWRPSVPDVDNTMKVVLDAMNAVVYTDDRKIIFGGCSTMYAAAWEEPGIEVHIWRAPQYPTGILAGQRPEGWAA